MKPKRQRAFTLIELMITVALLAIVSSIAIPNFADFVERNRQHAIRDEMLSALQYARAYAVMSGGAIELCASGNGEACQTDWSSGWMIRSLRSEMTHRHSRLARDNPLRWSGFSNDIVFYTNGTSPSSNGFFYQCHDKRVSWQVILSRQGRIRLGSEQENEKKLKYCS